MFVMIFVINWGGNKINRKVKLIINWRYLRFYVDVWNRVWM